MATSLASLIIEETKAAIYETALSIATSLGLPVSSWQPGDPTRSLFHLEAELLSTLESVVANFIRSGFLDYATGIWLKILADQVFNVQVPEATYASTDVVLTNAGGAVFEDIEPGAITFRNSATNKTYHNITGGTLAALGTLTLTVEADEAGSDSSAGPGEIDDLVTVLTEVTCTNPTAAIGTDEQEEATTRQQCRDKLGSLSPDGPAAAYAYVARNSLLTGTTAVTRVRVYSDSDTGDVTVYLAGPSGAVSSPVRALVEAAIVKWATPLCVTPTVLSTSNVTVAVTYTLWVYASANKTTAQVQADVQSALEALFRNHPIGGDIIPPALTGALYKSLIESTIRGIYPQVFRVSVSAPAGDTALTNGQVAVLGTITPTINIITDP